MASVDSTTIGLVRVRGFGAGRPSTVLRAGATMHDGYIAPTALRLAVAGMLSGADLRPPGFPPAAVLIVNRLDIPSHHRLPIRPGSRVDPAWERAAREAVATLYRQARLPLDQPVAPGSQAVLFRDEAELLACLALDLSLGRAGECWWWRTYRKRWGSLDRRILPVALLESPRSVPAALRLLAQRGKAVQVLQLLSPGDSSHVLDAVCSAFGIAPPDLSANWPAAALRQPPLPPQTPADAAASALDKAPWCDWLPSAVTTDLTPAGACLLGVALALAHAPSLARTAGFRHEVERWWRFEMAMRHDSDRGAHLKTPQQENSHPSKLGFVPVEPAASPAAAWVEDARPTPDSPASTEGSSPDSRLRPDKPFGLEPSRDLPLSRPAAPVGQDPAAPFFPEQTGAAHVQDSVAEKQPLERPLEIPKLAPMAAAAIEDGVATGLGGVLFLINVMQQLNLPHCLSHPWRPACQIGPWGVLELLGRGFLACQAHLAHDSLWTALAAIDGRRLGELPDAHFAGFASLPIPLTALRRPGGRPSVDGLEQAVDLAQVAPLHGPLLVGINPDLRRWLAVMLPLIREMLQPALGADFDIVSGLLLRSGRLYVAASHVDLVMPLNSVSLPVRLAGLDFDPGWQPDFGRVVQFHYE